MFFPNYIYGYIEPRPEHPKFGIVRYSGSDQVGGKRMKNFAAHDHGKVGPWIEELALDGLKPKIIILCQTSLAGAELFILEDELCLTYDTFNDLNDLHPGVWPPSTKGIKLGPEHRAKIAAAIKGKKLGPEHRAKLSAAKKGKKRGPQSEEHRAKISAANKGKKLGPRSEEHRAKLSAATKGKKRGPLSEEHRTKLSAANKGKKGIKLGPQSEEHRAKIAVANSKLNSNDIPEIRDLLRSKLFTQKEIAIMYRVGRVSINDIKRKRSWKHIKDPNVVG